MAYTEISTKPYAWLINEREGVEDALAQLERDSVNRQFNNNFDRKRMRDLRERLRQLDRALAIRF